MKELCTECKRKEGNYLLTEVSLEWISTYLGTVFMY